MTSDLLSPYLNAGNAVTVDADRYPEVSKNQSPDQINETLEPALNTKGPEKTVQEDLSKDQDYSSLRAALDQFKPVDYSAFKPDYLNLITEQERRAQKIRDDASKDASAQALIQLGAGLAAGDISKGLSAAGQSVADIKRQARAEARDEEGFARQLRLAQDEAGMQLGLKQAEAERSIQLQRAGMEQEEANAQANAEVRALEFEQEFGLKTKELAAMIRRDIMTSGKSSLSALIEQWKDLADAATEEDIAERNVLKDQIKTLIEEQKFLRDELRESLNADSSPNTVATAPTRSGRLIESARLGVVIIQKCLPSGFLIIKISRELKILIWLLRRLKKVFKMNKHYSNQKRNPLVLRSTHRHLLSLARLSLAGLVALFYLLPLVLLSWQTLPQTDWALKIL
jgi:hypothetical protein